MESIKWHKFIIMFLACLCLTGCGGSLPDTYQEGSDYQYMEKYVFTSFHQKGEGTEYFAYNGFIYYMDGATENILPLCGKADCLHDKEMDEEQKQKCNAYMETEADDAGIAYCNGYLYYVDTSIDSPPALYRLSADGMEKEQVYEWKDNITIEQWIVHRDVFYFAEHSYLANSGGTEERYNLKALPLNGKNIKKPETVYAVDENLDVFTLAHPVAYGNFLYFIVHGRIKTEDEVTDDNYMDYQFLKTFIYDIKKETVSELALPDMPKGNVVQDVVFWQDRIIFSPFDENKECLDPGTGTWYIADLDGSNIEVFMENVGQGLNFFSDGKYLYLSNVSMVSLEYDKGKEMYKVYDENLKMVDTITFPYKASSGFGEPAIGRADYMYMLYESGEKETSTEWGVACWDKRKIGSYDGSAFKLKKIKYRG